MYFILVPIGEKEKSGCYEVWDYDNKVLQPSNFTHLGVQNIKFLPMLHAQAFHSEKKQGSKME